MDDAVQPTRSEAVAFWNGLEAAERHRFVDGLDYERDGDMVSKLEASNMLFYVDPNDASDDVEAFVQGGVDEPLPVTEAVYAHELRLIIERSDPDLIDE